MKKGWQKKQLGELADLKGRIGWRGLTAKEYTESGPLFLSVHSLNYGDYIDFRDAFHISEERYVESPEIMIQEGDVLICKDGAGIGKVGIVGELPDRTTINSSLLLIRSGDSILPKFLYRCLSSPYFQKIVSSRLNGATTPHLYQRDITEFPVVVPPFPEQQRIVGILDEAFEGIATAKANAEKNLQNARALFESHLQSVFTQRGEGWLEKPLSDVCEVKDGTHDSPKYVANGIPFVTQKNIREEGLSFEKTQFISDEDHEKFYRRSNVAAGDILISMIGANRGMACVVDDERTFSIKNVGLVKRNAGLNQRFLLYFLKSPQAVNYVQTASKGGAQEFIGLTELRRFPVPLLPLSCQNRLADNFQDLHDETQRLASIYQQKLAALEALKKSLLHQAFTGQLTMDNG